MKVQRTISIDVEVQQKLQSKPEINVSLLVNDFLKKYLKEKQDEQN